jgi:HK97 family phage portal protein
VIVRTFEGLQSLTTPSPWAPSTGSVALYDQRQSYADIYRTQPNVRLCIDFLARNIAELSHQIFRRVSDTDRVRLADHELAQWMGDPNPGTSEFRLKEGLVADLGLYFNAYWLKARTEWADGRPRIGLVRLPPEQMHVVGGLLPEKYCWTVNGRVKEFALSEVVYFNGYNPLNPLMGLSPLETLRRILAEESAANDHREGMWRNSARIEGVVTRPATAKRYTDTQAQSWREQWQAAYAGGAGAGKTVLLQEGETFTPTGWSAKDSEFTAGGKLRREVCAAAYHIPLPLVGILEHATFSNIKEQHKHLYQDCLGPWLKMIVQEIKRQLLIECDDQRDVYTEFNIDAKLAGTPEERATSIQVSTGRPWRTVNEARALENLPRIDDPRMDEVAPQQGGPSDATARPERQENPAATDDDDEDIDALAPILDATRARQRARLAKLPAAERASAFFADLERYNRELAADLTPIVGATKAATRAIQANVATLALIEHTS